jgi:hypothetical protein
MWVFYGYSRLQIFHSYPTFQPLHFWKIAVATAIWELYTKASFEVVVTVLQGGTNIAIATAEE